MIELNDTLTAVLFYQGLIKQTSEAHKNHHVQFVKNNNEYNSDFYCLDCEKTFTSELCNMRYLRRNKI